MNLAAISGTNRAAVSGMNLATVSGTNLATMSGTNLATTSGTNLAAVSGTNLAAVSGTKLAAVSSQDTNLQFLLVQFTIKLQPQFSVTGVPSGKYLQSYPPSLNRSAKFVTTAVITACTGE